MYEFPPSPLLTLLAIATAGRSPRRKTRGFDQEDALPTRKRMLYSKGPGVGRGVFGLVWLQTPPASALCAAQPLSAASGCPPPPSGWNMSWH